SAAPPLKPATRWDSARSTISTRFFPVVSRATVSADESIGLSAAERLAVTALSVFVVPVIAAYLLDRLGLAFAPTPLLLLALAAAALTAVWVSKGAAVRWGEIAALASVVFASFAGLLWLARPALLPLGTGLDLTHHLLLVEFIERHWRLVHDPSLEAYL